MRHSPCEEALLNKLLNEMDGLKEEADILFILTTNRPEALEGPCRGPAASIRPLSFRCRMMKAGGEVRATLLPGGQRF